MNINRRNNIAVQNIDVLDKAAGSALKRFSGYYSFDELKSFGVEGLLQAAENYESMESTDFAKFAFKRIYYSIIDEMRKNSKLKRGNLRKFQDIVKEADLETGKRNLDLVEDNFLRDAIAIAHPFSMDYPIYFDKSKEPVLVHDIVEDKNSFTPEEYMLWKEERLEVSRALQHLPERDFKVLHLSFVNQMIQPEIGEMLGISACAVSMGVKQALQKLKVLIMEPQRIGYIELKDLVRLKNRPRYTEFIIPFRNIADFKPVIQEFSNRNWYKVDKKVFEQEILNRCAEDKGVTEFGGAPFVKVTSFLKVFPHLVEMFMNS